MPLKHPLSPSPSPSKIVDLSADRDYEVDNITPSMLNGKKIAAASISGHIVNDAFKREILAEKGSFRTALHQVLMKFCDELKTK